MSKTNIVKKPSSIKPTMENVSEVICQELGVDSEEVTPEAEFTGDLGADSLDTVELIMAFEERFGLEIPDDDAEEIKTVADALAYLERRTAGK